MRVLFTNAEATYKFLENRSFLLWLNILLCQNPLPWAYTQDPPRQFKTTLHFWSVSSSLPTKLLTPFKIVFMDVRDETLKRGGLFL